MDRKTRQSPGRKAGRKVRTPSADEAETRGIGKTDPHKKFTHGLSRTFVDFKSQGTCNRKHTADGRKAQARLKSWGKSPRVRAVTREKR